MSSEPRLAELRIPADPRMLRLARVTAASMAADLPFTLQDIEDLRVAVDELSAALIDGCDASATLELSFQVVGQELRVTGAVKGAGPAEPLHPVAADLLGLLATDHTLTNDGDDRMFSFAKSGGVTQS